MAQSGKTNDVLSHDFFFLRFFLRYALCSLRSALSHLITLSARNNTDCGIVRLRCFRGLQINYELELRRLLNGQIPRLGAFEDLVDVDRSALKTFSFTGCIGDEAASFDVRTLLVH